MPLKQIRLNRQIKQTTRGTTRGTEVLVGQDNRVGRQGYASLRPTSNSHLTDSTSCIFRHVRFTDLSHKSTYQVLSYGTCRYTSRIPVRPHSTTYPIPITWYVATLTSSPNPGVDDRNSVVRCPTTV